MTEKTPPETEADVRQALDVLVERLEREYAWVQELRDDLVTSERLCQRLLTSCDAAIQALPEGTRLSYLARVMKVRVGPKKVGKPPQDGRQRAILDFLAGRLDDTVTSAEIRLMLETSGYAGTPAYVSNTLAKWAAEGMLTRLSQGVFKVNPRDNRLRAIRFRTQDADIRAEITAGRAAAKAHFDDQAAEDRARQKAKEFKRLRRENFYNPPSE